MSLRRPGDRVKVWVWGDTLGRAHRKVVYIPHRDLTEQVRKLLGCGLHVLSKTR